MQGSNYIAAFNSLGWNCVSCFGHNLNLAVSKAADGPRMKQTINKCHSITEVFTRSWKKTTDLRLKQGLSQHKLITDVSTRWGSTYQMVSRILFQQQAICAVLAEDRKHRYKMLWFCPRSYCQGVLPTVLLNRCFVMRKVCYRFSCTTSTGSHLHKKFSLILLMIVLLPRRLSQLWWLIWKHAILQLLWMGY